VLTRNTINFLRFIRHLGLLALSPLDYLSRPLNNKTDFPPLHLRRYVGPLRSFESSGAEFMSYLRLLASLRPDERILDIGCGFGLMAPISRIIFMKLAVTWVWHTWPITQVGVKRRSAVNTATFSSHKLMFGTSPTIHAGRMKPRLTSFL
jgi:hypothetical protein